MSGAEKRAVSDSAPEFTPATASKLNENCRSLTCVFVYASFYPPRLLAMSVMALGLNSTATAIAALRERNT
ncbi:hypothetical protein PPH41_28685, partial [Burkholderia gladioli]|nr:hypothetical protein [Burkholderia gladioli]